MWFGKPLDPPAAFSAPPPPPPEPPDLDHPPPFQQTEDVWQPPSRRASLLASLRNDSVVDPPLLARRRSSRTPSIPSLTQDSSCAWDRHSDRLRTPQYPVEASPQSHGKLLRRSSGGGIEAYPLQHNHKIIAASSPQGPLPDSSHTPQYPVKAPGSSRPHVRHGSSGAERLTDHQQPYNPASTPPQEAPSITCSAAGIDLNSASALTPNISFVDPDLHHSPILVVGTSRPLRACEVIKKWLYFCSAELAASGNLRMETQDLHLLDQTKPAHLVLLESAADFDGDPRRPIAILALFSKDDSSVRWFYTLLHCGELLRLLGQKACLAEEGIALHPQGKQHRTLFVFLQQAFTQAIEIPHHPDFLAAQQLTDYCPSIADPETALTRLSQALSTITHAPVLLTPSSIPPADRYSPHLPLPERQLAHLLSLPSSAYLLLKRRFFHDFWSDLLAKRERIGDRRKKVRTEAAHEAWLVSYEGLVQPRGGKEKEKAERKLKGKEAKRLVVGWRVLGFLEEKRFLGWLKGGGLLEDAVAEEV
ncbi:hypothetical protein B0A55_03347 [Friedmanniomyces simplex]|uniref:Uncharacterized protein n=1 Tax=Friedmanniomyces simplex TaxID=329884 RepID=A0A4U0XR91_9PEZI|nr:hypothetical protein B0A55_03347 [Friedmanniomyces simplex]